MNLLKITSPHPMSPGPLALRCPGCRHQATFQPLADLRDFRIDDAFTAGQRVCSTPSCNTHVFVVYDSNGKVVEAYPPELLDFDPAGIPDLVTASFEEALSCHANSCFKAAAMMVRRTLEELCAHQGIPSQDPKSGKDVNLKNRLDSLKDVVVLPQALFDALHDLRLLGNDAAHVVSKDYDDVGREEVEVAIELTKEVLKAVYQLGNLVNRLKALKKPAP